MATPIASNKHIITLKKRTVQEAVSPWERIIVPLAYDDSTLDDLKASVYPPSKAIYVDSATAVSAVTLYFQDGTNTVMASLPAGEFFPLSIIATSNAAINLVY